MIKVKKKDRVYVGVIAFLGVALVIGSLGVVNAFSGSSKVVVEGDYIESSEQSSEEVVGLGIRTDTIMIEKSINYDDIITTGVDITGTSLGDFYIENIIMESNVNSMASGTLFEVLTSGDTYGSSTVVFSTQVTAFPKAISMDLFTRTTPWDNKSATSSFQGTASSTQRAILEDGSKLVVRCTDADCMRNTDGTETGDGLMQFTILLRRVSNISQIYD